jgi:PAS domain S-box-containing protein
MLQENPAEPTAFLRHGGECGALIAARDWSASLGDPARWPQALKTATNILLRSPVPMAMLWGEDGIMLYNDAYSVFAGGRHPEQLGMKVREGWPEVADFNDHVMKVGMAGGTLQFRDQELTLHRHGRPEQVWMNLDYSPVPDDAGEPAGVLAVVIETTARVAAERQQRVREQRLRFFDRLSETVRVLRGPDQIMGETARLLGEELRASVVAYADMGEDQDRFTIRGDWASPGSKSIVGSYRLEDFGPTAFNNLRAGRPLITRDTLAELGPEDGKGLLALGLGATVCMPYVKNGRLTALMAVHQLTPRNWSADELDMINEATDRSWAHVERVRTEAVLRESEQRFRNMADNTPVMMWVTDQKGHCTYLNRRWYEYTGQAPGEGEAMGWLNAVHPEDRPAAERVFMDSAGRQVDYQIDFRLRRADGEYRWVIDAAATRFDAQGRYMGYVGSVIDIDERRETEALARNSEATLRSVIEQMPIGVATARVPSGETIEFNDTLREILGHPQGPSGASKVDRFGGVTESGEPLPPERYPLHRAACLGETVVNDEFRYRRPDGEVVHLLANAAPVLGSSGKAEIAVLTIQDVTERHRAEQHQRLLIDELSHRAKNLLAIIQSVAQQSFKGEAAPAEMLRAFEGRLGALAAAHGILTRRNWESAPIKQIVCDTITAVKADDERLRIDGPTLMVSPKTGVSLAMAVHELTTNAVKYGSLGVTGGSVTVRWEIVDGRLRLEWIERGGPPVQQPTRRGFGSRMIERALAAELGGKARIEFNPEGVVCTVDAPLPEGA